MPRYRFSDVELDLDRFEVTRAGRRLALEPKAILVLQFLVERPDRLVTRDELLDGVWPGVAVTPNALTRVVAQLRRELGDDATEARFIETVPTRGYRFIATIDPRPAGGGVAGPPAGPSAAGPVPPVATVAYTERPVPGVSAGTPPGSAPAGRAHPARPARRALQAAALLAGVAVAAWLLAARRAAEPPAGPTPLLPAEAGSILSAEYSPDGRWLAVVSDDTGDFEIVLRDVETSATRPLTADGMRNVHAAWSPDSSRVVYHSSRRRGIWTMAATGGPARQLAPVGSRPRWSPDGRWIAYQSDEFVTDPAQPGSQILVVPADGGAPPRELTRAGDPPGGHFDPCWAPDGQSIYFATTRNGPIDYWSVRLRDGLLTQRAGNWGLRVLAITAGAMGDIGWGVNGAMLDGRLLRVALGDDAAMRQRGPEVVFEAPSGGIRSMTVAPGGRQAALVLLDMADEVWTVPITAAGAPSGEARRLADGGHPAISPDGRQVAYDAGADIRVRRLDGDGERRVLRAGRRALYPTWRDDRTLFAMRVDGLSRFFVEVDLETGAAVERLRLPEAASFPRVAPDGDTVVATIGEPLNGLGRGSLSAGTFGPWPLFADYAFAIWSPDGRQLALEKKAGASMPMFLADAATGAARPVSPPEGQFWPGAFSPDGQRVATAVLEGHGTWRIEVVDLATGQRTPVTGETSPEVISRYPSWSPRGGLLAYERVRTRGTLRLVDLPVETRN